MKMAVKAAVFWRMPTTMSTSITAATWQGFPAKAALAASAERQAVLLLRTAIRSRMLAAVGIIWELFSASLGPI